MVHTSTIRNDRESKEEVIAKESVHITLFYMVVWAWFNWSEGARICWMNRVGVLE